jgi:hypothetical protein
LKARLFAADNRLVVAHQRMLVDGEQLEDDAPLALDAGTMLMLVTLVQSVRITVKHVVSHSGGLAFGGHPIEVELAAGETAACACTLR